MTQLFSNGTIKDNAEVIAGYDQQKAIDVVRQLHDDFGKGLMKNETAYEQRFNQLFFVELLGYDQVNNLRPKAPTPVGGKIADGVLGIFEDGQYTFEGVQVAIELKDCTIPLDKKQLRVNTQTPVEQGFMYKTSFANCKWVIVSNFASIRLYRDNKLDFEVWTLDQLLDDADNYFQLRKLILLLHAKRLLSNGPESYTERLLSKIRVEQQEITKKFYKEYKNLRFELINDIRLHNKDLGIEIIVEKAQKIIDRIVFIHFCEDKGLLPDGKLRENIYRAAEVDFTPWEVLRRFFTGVDSGSEKLGIPFGYNGELFKPDFLLDTLGIGDTICKKFVELGEFDFKEKLSVNILGHIFEQSISDIEQLKIDLLGQELETEHLVEKKESKRKKDGIFYTPEYIVDYIVQNSVMKYLSEKEDQCLKKYKTDETKAYLAYQQILQNIKVLDPACGSGAFLVRVFDVLLEENKRVGQILNSLFDDTELYKSILTNNIYGVDLNAESVEITKLSLWLKSAQKGKKLNNLDANIKCGNSLIDDPAIAGDKAFDWKKEFKEIFTHKININQKTKIIDTQPEEGKYNITISKKHLESEDVDTGFDVVVGNPPYTYRGSIGEMEKKYFKENYNSIEGNYDLYKIFMEKIQYLLKKGGISSFIVPNTFLSAQTYHKLRDILVEKFFIEEIFDLGLGIFEDVIVESIIFCIKRSDSISNKTIIKVQRDRKKPIFYLEKEYIIDIAGSQRNNGAFNIYLSEGIKSIINKIKDKKILLRDICYCTVGINTGYIKSNMVADHKISEKYHKSLNGKNISRNAVNRDGKRIIYDQDFVKSFGDKGRSLPPEYVFNEDKILVQRTRRGMKRKLVCYFDNQRFYNLNRLSNIVLTDKSRFNLKYIYMLLNSELLDYYFNNFFNEYEVKPLHLGQLPIPKISLSDQQPFIERADKMLSLNKDLHELTDNFLKRIQDNLHIQKLTKKLELFYDREFKDFIDELKKQKIFLSLKDQDEREPYFTEHKEKILSIKSQIERTDNEIDEMVFDLYGLTEEERRVVLGE